jgi:radical SAM protein with 4Fe4S-binding SPASM domain
LTGKGGKEDIALQKLKSYVMIKISPYSYGHLPLYLYLIGAYSKFLTVGKCLDFPLTLLVQTQSFCNGRCSICPYPTVSKRLAQGRMEWSLFQKIVDEATSEPLLSAIVFELHNEPLLDERIFDWVKYIKSRGASKNVALITNGELLDRFSSEDIVQSNLDTLIVSLNAYSREMYESINTGLDYDRVMNNVSRLLSDQSTRQKTRLGFVVTEQNEDEVYKATKYWKKQRVKTRVSGATNRAGSLDNYERFRPKTDYYHSSGLETVWRRLMTGVRHVVGCHVPFYEMSILFNGDVLICSEDWNRTTVVGNVTTQSLREIWDSKKINEIRRLLLRKRFEQIDSCQECSLAR